MTRLRDGDRVLVRAPSWLGDFVACEPLLRALHARLPLHGRGSLSIAAPARLLALLDGRLAGAQRLSVGREGPRPQAWRGHDVALLLDGSWRSAWCAWRASIPERLGSARGGRGPLLTSAYTPARERGAAPVGVGRRGRFPRWLPRPFGAVCAEIGAWLGVEVRDPRPRLAPGDRGRAAARARLERAGVREGEPYLLVNAAARPGSAKGAPAELLEGVLAELARARAPRTLLLTAPGETETARRVAELAPGATLLDDPPPDLEELVALCASSACLLTADCGARHVAVALGTPAVVVFGPTDPRHGAEHLERVRGLRVEVPCGPCHRERCPLEGSRRHACMTRIDPRAVAAAALELVGARRSDG